MKKYNFINTIFLISALAIFGTVAVFPQTTDFSYQGFLSDTSASANGNFDFEFRLFDAAAGGVPIGTIQRLNIQVMNGVFSVTLDFGAFGNADRFLEIGVRPSGGGAFTTLAPRSKVLAVPLATNAQNATNATNATTATTANNALQLGGVTANQFVQTNDSRLTDARNPLPNSTNYVQNRTTQQTTSNFNISGTGTANIFSAGTQYNIGNDRVIGSPGFNFFAGISAGTSNTTGIGNAFFGLSAGTDNTTGNNNSFFGIAAGANNSTGSSNSYFGTSAGINSTTAGFNSFVGADAGRNTTLGGRNSFFGFSAGSSNTSGTRNSFFGTEAGLSSTGQDNSFFGDKAGRLTTGGGRNSFFGSGAGENNTGSDNVFIGNGAGSTNTTGSSNTAVGAGSFFTEGTGSNNTLIGAGASVEFGSSFATAIGAGASIRGSNQINLGRSAGLDTVFVPGTLSVDGAVNLAIQQGNVGIGSTATPERKLDVRGIVRVGAGTTGGCIEDRSGTVIAGTCNSDARFKKNITPFGSILNNFSKLRPVNYYWRTDEFPEQYFGTKQSYGLIAQEVEEIFPELVATDEKGFKAVNYSKLPFYTIQAVKELKAENDALKKQVENQNQQLNAQQNQLEKQITEIDEQKKKDAAQQTQLNRQQAEIKELSQIVKQITNAATKTKVKRSKKQ